MSCLVACEIKNQGSEIDRDLGSRADSSGLSEVKLGSPKQRGKKGTTGGPSMLFDAAFDAASLPLGHWAGWGCGGSGGGRGLESGYPCVLLVCPKPCSPNQSSCESWTSRA